MVKQMAELAHGSQVRTPATFLAVAEMRSCEDDFAPRVPSSFAIDFRAATTMLLAFTTALALLLTARVPSSIPNLSYDLFPVAGIVARFDRHSAILPRYLAGIGTFGWILAWPSTALGLPHGRDLAKVIRPALCGFLSANAAE